MFFKKEIGNFGEDLACRFLERKGYKILKRNIQRGHMEIDIIAQKDDEMVFAEVRTCSTLAYGGAEEAINFAKLRKFRQAVILYAENYNLDLNYVRMDFLAVDIDSKKNTVKIKHFKEIV